MEERAQRRVRLTVEEKWQVFLEASPKGSMDAEVCRRWGVSPSQFRVIGDGAREGATGALARRPGRPRKDAKVAELEAELERTGRALKELAIENTSLRGKPMGLDRAHPWSAPAGGDRAAHLSGRVGGEAGGDDC